MIKYIIFENELELKIVGEFGSPQDPTTTPFYGEVEDTDQRYIDWLYPPIIGPTLSEAKESKRLELRTACSDEIERTSFSSSALGAIHNYDCRLVDQINLKMRYDIALAQVSEEPLWASDGTRFEWKDHSAEELLEVMMDMNDNIKANQQKLATKMASVDAATTNEQVALVEW